MALISLLLQNTPAQHNDTHNILPENAGIIILSMKALVSRNYSVEQTLARVEAAQALHQPPVA